MRVRLAPWMLAVAAMFVMQVAWMLTIPPFRGSDEVDHAYRAAAVAGGEWVAGDPAADGRGWLVTVPRELADAAKPQCEELGYQGPDNCNPVEQAGNGEVLIASSAAAYHPVYYWITGVSGLPFDGTRSLYAMRSTSMLLCLLFFGLAAWAAGRLRSRFPLIGLVVATSPVLAYSTIVLAPNGLEMSAALALWCSMLALVYQEADQNERLLVLAAISSAVVLGSLRLIGPLFILLIVGTVLCLRPRRLLDVVRRRSRLIACGAVAVAMSVVQFAWWTFGPWTLASPTGPADEPESFDVWYVAAWQLQTIAAFPYRDQLGAAAVYPVVGALALGLLYAAWRVSARRERWCLAAAVLGATLLPVVLTLATIDGRGAIWQGRYGLPYAVGFILISGYLLAGSSRIATGLSRRLGAVAAVALAAVVAACLIKVRSDELRSNDASAADTAWHSMPPVVIGVLLFICAGCWWTMARHERPKASEVELEPAS